MAAHELCLQSISQLAEGIKSRQVSPVEITAAFLERIQQLDARLNSFITVVADQALQEAKEAEREIGRSGPRGPAAGRV